MTIISRTSRAIQYFLRQDASLRSFNCGAVNSSQKIIPSSNAASTFWQHHDQQSQSTPTRRFYSPSTSLKKQAWDPSLDEYKYWNRENSKHGEASYVLDMSPESIQREARILCLADVDDDPSKPLTDSNRKLPFGSRLLHVGTQPADFPDALVDENPNVLFVSPSCPHARLQLPLILHKFPTIEWIHVRSAGIDFLESDELPGVTKKGIVMTNAKGQFSSSLAEYVMMACSYFAKVSIFEILIRSVVNCILKCSSCYYYTHLCPLNPIFLCSGHP